MPQPFFSYFLVRQRTPFRRERSERAESPTEKRVSMFEKKVYFCRYSYKTL